MRQKSAVALVFAFWLISAAVCSDDTGRFTSVGGDYGKNLMSTYKSESQKESDAKSDDGKSTLWSWGSAPKGSLIVDGNLMKDPRYYLKNLTVTTNWLGDSLADASDGMQEFSYFDPVTGHPVKTYKDSVTGQIYYIITDPETQKEIYVYFNPITGQPLYTKIAPGSGTAENENSKDTSSIPLAPIFNS